VAELGLGFVNEYMTVESAGERLGTFPDVITTCPRATDAGVDRGHSRR
jgi:hypothetical protein